MVYYVQLKRFLAQYSNPLVSMFPCDFISILVMEAHARGPGPPFPEVKIFASPRVSLIRSIRHSFYLLSILMECHTQN